MNKELKKFIEEELELNNLSPSEKHTKVKAKIAELEKVAEELEEFREEELREELFKPIKEIENKIKVEFSDLKVENKFYEKDDAHYEIIIPFKLRKNQFACLLNFFTPLYEPPIYEYGVYPYPLNNKMDNNVADFLKSLLKKKTMIIDESGWYGLKQTSEQNAFNEFKNLIKVVIAELDKEKNKKR